MERRIGNPEAAFIRGLYAFKLSVQSRSIGKWRHHVTVQRNSRTTEAAGFEKLKRRVLSLWLNRLEAIRTHSRTRDQATLRRFLVAWRSYRDPIKTMGALRTMLESFSSPINHKTPLSASSLPSVSRVPFVSPSRVVADPLSADFYSKFETKWADEEKKWRL